MIEKPRKGEGLWRHCYIGQEDKLMTILGEKGLTIEQFNQVWDAISVKEAREQRSNHGENAQSRENAIRRIRHDLAEQVSEYTEPFNLFVPDFAPRYREMVERGGIAGVSLEDSTRKGVWVRLSWYSKQSEKKRPLSVAEIQAAFKQRYTVTDEQWAAIPDAKPR